MERSGQNYRTDGSYQEALEQRVNKWFYSERKRGGGREEGRKRGEESKKKKNVKDHVVCK